MQIFAQPKNFLQLSAQFAEQWPSGLKIRIYPNGRKIIRIKNIFAQPFSMDFKGTGFCCESAYITAGQQRAQHMGKNGIGVFGVGSFQMAVT